MSPRDDERSDTIVDSQCSPAIIMPDDVALEKVKALEALGAEVQRVRPASIVDKKQARLH